MSFPDITELNPPTNPLKPAFLLGFPVIRWCTYRSKTRGGKTVDWNRIRKIHTSYGIFSDLICLHTCFVDVFALWGNSIAQCLGMKECNFHASTFCVHKEKLVTLHDVSIRGKSWLKHVEHDFTLYDIPPRCGFKFFNSEKCLKNSEKKLLEIKHVKLQTKIPKKRLIFFPTAEVCIFMYFFASFAFQVWFVWCSPLWGAGWGIGQMLHWDSLRCSDIWTVQH